MSTHLIPVRALCFPLDWKSKESIFSSLKPDQYRKIQAELDCAGSQGVILRFACNTCFIAEPRRWLLNILSQKREKRIAQWESSETQKSKSFSITFTKESSLFAQKE